MQVLLCCFSGGIFSMYSEDREVLRSFLRLNESSIIAEPSGVTLFELEMEKRRRVRW
jgi:hypothetical protein